MGIATAGFERGVNAATITTAAGEGDSTPFNQANLGTGSTAVYDNTRAAVGAQAAKLTTNASAGTCFLGWTEARPEIAPGYTDWYGRVYVYFASPAPPTFTVVTFTNSGAAACTLRVFNTAGVLNLRHQDSLVAFTQLTNPIPLDQWVRLEWHFVHSTTVGWTEVKMFSPADSLTPIETSTSPLTRNTNTLCNRFNFGVNPGTANIGPFWLDGILVGATSYPGPLVPGGTGGRLLLDVGV